MFQLELSVASDQRPTGIKDRYKENCISRPKSTFPLGDDPKCVLVTWQLKKKNKNGVSGKKVRSPVLSKLWYLWVINVKVYKIE